MPETEEQAGRRQALEATEQRVRVARSELEAAEQAFIDLGGDMSGLDEAEYTHTTRCHKRVEVQLRTRT